MWHLIRKEYWLFSPAFFSKISFVTAHVSFYFQIPIHSNPRYVIRIMSLELNAVHHNDHPLCSSSSFSSFSSLLLPPSPSPRKKESSSLTRSISWCLIVRRSINTSVRKRRKKERGGRERERERERDLYSKTLNGTLKKKSSQEEEIYPYKK